MKRNLYFLMLIMFFAIFNTNLTAQHIDAGPDVTICEGDQTVLHADLTQVNTGRYVVQSIPFNWDSDFSTAHDVTESGIPMRIDDRYSDAITLPFSIKFFGQSYDQIVVGSNGDIIFETSIAGQYDAWPIDPSELIPNHTLPYWDDLTSVSFASIMGAYYDIDVGVPSPNLELLYKTVGTAPNRKFIIIYNEIPQFSCNNLLAFQQIVFNENDASIEVHIQNREVCTSWNSGLATLGIQNEELLPDTCGYYPGDATSPTLPNRNTGTWAIISSNPESYVFMPNANPQITWYDANHNVIGTTADVTVSPTVETIYTLEVTFEDCHGNIFTEFDEVMVTPIPAAELELPENAFICANETAQIDGTLSNASLFSTINYTWTDNAGNVVGNDAVLSVSQAGEYSLTVEVNGGCMHTFGPVVITQFETCQIPEGISPNGDGLNEYFVLDWLAYEPGIDNLQIYDRRGVLVYEKDNYVKEFDGKNKDGKDLPAAAYYYVIKLADGEMLTGWLQIER
jgi:gliding motility-associated-like protein